MSCFRNRLLADGLPDEDVSELLIRLTTSILGVSLEELLKEDAE